LVGGREAPPHDQIPERFAPLEPEFGARRGFRPAPSDRDQQRLAGIEGTRFERLEADLEIEFGLTRREAGAEFARREVGQFGQELLRPRMRAERDIEQRPGSRVEVEQRARALVDDQ
jgi:hypothetical protein